GGIRVLAQALHYTFPLKEKHLNDFGVTFDDGRDKEDLEEVLRAFPDMRDTLYRQ
ncbi:hypothetical protein GBAR_LOCUS12225, partial [Geodia barretti]